MRLIRAGRQALVFSGVSAVSIGQFGLAVVQTAHADPLDDEFTSALKASGVASFDPLIAPGLGRSVCSTLADGPTPIESLAENVADGSNLLPPLTYTFVNTAVATYCPQLRASVTGEPALPQLNGPSWVTPS